MAEVTGADPFVLTGARAQSPAVAGGKGAALARLAATFPVPAFFVIPAEAFDDAGLKPQAKRAVDQARVALGVGPFAVRSSGREEDGADSAHAGQFETELNVASADVAAAAHRVWKSGFSETLAQYRKAKGLSGAPQPPAVVVQRMVQAKAAGVAFSADPVSGDRTVVIISAIAGLADKLVGGEADGDSYRIGANGKTLDAQLVGAAPVLNEAQRAEVAALARQAEVHFGSPQDIEWAFDAALNMLQSRPITTLKNEGSASVSAAAADSDVTIWDNSNIVESYPGVTSPLTFSFARYVYSNVYQSFSKLMGVSPRTVEDHRAVFENMLGRIDGRIYYNLLNWYRALALFPGFKANRAFMEGMMGVSEALPQQMADAIAPPEHDAGLRFLDNLNLLRVGGGLLWHQLWIKGTIANFYKRLNAALATPDSAIDTMDAPRLAAEYRKLEQQLLARWDAPLVNDFLCMIAFGAAQAAMKKWAGDDGVAYLSAQLIGQGNIISAEPARLIRKMGAMAADKPDVVRRLAAADRSAVSASPELQAAFDAYIARFGDRCTQELKLESRTLHEDPGQVLMAIAAAAGKSDARGNPSPLWGGAGVGGSSTLPNVENSTALPPPTPTVAAGAAPPHKEEGLTLKTLIPSQPKRAFAGWLLSWAGARVRDRENLRFERTRLFGRVRRIFLGIGARLTEAGALSAPRDVFDLTVEELLGAVEGASITADLKALAALRESEMKASLARPDPPERFSIRGAQSVGATSLIAQPVAASGETSETRKGLACCKGVVTAKVRVIEDPRVEALGPGEILVARHTDPGWIAVFANAAGVIAERGSLLSHSAIVAREMGVPCVVSLKGVTQWLKTGDTVRLDGGAGTVERVSRDG